GAVDELVRDDDMAGCYGILKAAHRRDGYDPLHAQLLHAEDVGAVVNLGGEESVPASVTGKKHHPHPVQHTADILVRRIAEGGFHPHTLYPLQPFHLVEAAATDNTNRRITHESIPFPDTTIQPKNAVNSKGFGLKLQ